MKDTKPVPIGYIEAPPCAAGSGAVRGPTTLRVGRADPAAAPEIVAVVAAAFLRDPTWSWAFPEPAVRKRYWQVCVADALRYSWVFRTDEFEAASIWIPPGGTEFSRETEEHFAQLLLELAGPRAADVAELIRRFAAGHPRREPHYYLSLLGTAADHRGRGLGMALLKENLARIDAEGMPAYLESSNSQNDHRYAALGFVPIVSFAVPGSNLVVTGMWRNRL